MSATAEPLQRSTRNGRTQAERSARSDRGMLEAAVRLIVDRGSAGTTLKGVGEAAGYSRGLAGYRFGSKEGLFKFVVRAIGEEWLRELKHVVDRRTGLDAIRAATDAHHRFCREAPDHVRAFYILWFESMGPGSGVRETIASVHRRRQQDVREWIEAGKRNGSVRQDADAAAVAAQFCASIIGIVYQWMMEGENGSNIQRMHGDLVRTMTLWLEPGVTGK